MDDVGAKLLPEWHAVQTGSLPGAPVRSLFCCSATPLWWEVRRRAVPAKTAVQPMALMRGL
jgi:hypothetical protein